MKRIKPHIIPFVVVGAITFLNFISTMEYYRWLYEGPGIEIIVMGLREQDEQLTALQDSLSDARLLSRQEHHKLDIYRSENISVSKKIEIIDSTIQRLNIRYLFLQQRIVYSYY